MAAAATKGVRKLDRPRPLRSAPSEVGDPSGGGTPSLFPPAAAVPASRNVIEPVETLCTFLDNGNRDAQTLSQIAGVCRLLKDRGADMDRDYEKILDRCFAIFRNASRDNQLSFLDRLRLVEVIEMRAMRWKGDEALAEQYGTRYAQFENAECEKFDDASSTEEQRLLKQVQPSEQRPQTDKPGTTTDLGGQPKVTAADGNTGEWEKSVSVGMELLRISGTNETIVNVATSVLQTFFTNTSVDAFCSSNQTLSCVPSDALAGKAVAQPINNISRPGDAADALGAQNTSEAPGISNASENKGFVCLGSQTRCTSTGIQVSVPDCKSWGSNDRPDQAKCFDRLGNLPQISGPVEEESVFSTVSKTMGTASKLDPPEPIKGLENSAQLARGDDGRQFSAGFNALGSTGNYTQSGQFGSRKGLTPLSSDADIQKLDPSGDCKRLASGDMTNRSRQLSNVRYSKQHFNTTDKQMTKALDNIDIPSQPKQSKGLGRPAQFLSKAHDNNRQPLSNDFTATTCGTSGQNQRKQTGVKTPSVNELPTEKQQPKVLESLAESGNSDDKSQVPKHTLSPNCRVYSRDFLVQCSHSPLATKMPPDFPLLDPEVASVMLRKSCK